MKRINRYLVPFTILVFVAASAAAEARGRGGGGGFRGGGGGVRSSGFSSVNRGASMNRGGGASMNRGASVNRGAGMDRGNINRGNANLNRNSNVNRNTNRNVDRNVNRDIDVEGDRWGGYYGGGGCCYRPYAPIARTAAAVATGIAIGSVAYSLPSTCTTTVVNGMTYQQCGNTWYQPQMSGSTTSYVVVNPP